MIVQLICPDCNGFGMDESMGPQDIFWVECRYDEAVKVVMPWVKSKQTEKAEKIAAEIERNYRLHIPVMRNHSSGELETACPELETALDHHLLAKQFI